MSKILGIDIGALTSRVAELSAERKMPVVLRNGLSNESTPTLVAYSNGEVRAFGEAVGGKDISRPQATIDNVKTWSMDEAAAVRDLRGEEYAPEQILGFMVKRLKEYTKNWDTMAKVAVAVPPNAQVLKKRLQVAAAIAGIDNNQLVLVEEQAAVGAYVHHLRHEELPETPEEATRMIVVNSGHSTTAVAVYRLSKVSVELEAISSIANGSVSIDEALTNYIFDEIQKKHGEDIRGHRKSFNKVRRESRKAKEMLSSVDQARIQVECLLNDIDFTISISRVKLEEVSAPFVKQLNGLLDELASKVDGGFPNRVEAIGGAWRSPVIQNVFKGRFEVERLGVSLDANLAVAEGCAIASMVKLPEIGGEDRFATHQCELNSGDVTVPEALSAADAEAVVKFTAVEEVLEAEDTKLSDRIKAVDRLESLILSTREEARAALTGDDQKKLMDILETSENYVYDDCEGADTEAINSRTESLDTQIASDFPGLETYREQKREEQRKKDEELERLSKLQEEDKELKTDPQRLRGAQQRREQGVTLFKQECFQEAQTRFVQALGILGQLYAPQDDDVKPKKNEIALSCHLNIASCSVKLGMWRNAVNNCTNALEIEGQSKNAKALYRRGQARAALHEHDEAMKDLELAKEITNGDAAIVAEIAALKQKMENMKAKEKKMFSKMFA